MFQVELFQFNRFWAFQSIDFIKIFWAKLLNEGMLLSVID